MGDAGGNLKNGDYRRCYDLTQVTVKAYGLAEVIVYAGFRIRLPWSLFEAQINLNKKKDKNKAIFLTSPVGLSLLRPARAKRKD